MPGFPAMTLGTVQFGTWHHIAVSYNQANKTFQAFLDGQIAATSLGERVHPHDSGRTAVYAFGRGGAKNLGTGSSFKGLIDEVRTWRRAVAASEINLSYRRVLSGTQDGLYANWHFDSSSGSEIPDDTDKANPALYVPVGSPPVLVLSGVPLSDLVQPFVQTTAPIMGPNAAAQFTGIVNTRGTPMSVYFEWGSTPAYGLATARQPVSGAVDVTFGQLFNNLPPGEYHYRAVATAGDVIVLGLDQVCYVPTIAGQAIVRQ